MRPLPLVLSLSLLLTTLGGCAKEPPEGDKTAVSTAALPARTENGEPAAPASQAEPSPKVAVARDPVRKDLVVLTPRAAERLREILKPMKGPQFLRVRVVDGQYKLDFDPVADPATDYVGVSRGVRVVVDRESSLLVVAGTVVDFIDEGGKKIFTVIAPSEDLGPPDPAVTLEQARRGFKTNLARRERTGTAPPEPPAGVMRLVRYESPAGKLAAYLSPDPKDGKKHPAIVWIHGGDCNSIAEECLQEGPPENEQSAAAYRKAGLVVMFPSLRGGSGNPGVKEGFFGEVDDVVAAADFLRRQPFVDPGRVYLGGHSTGGTLALLTAECTDRFRAVFSFGPVDNVLGYGPAYNPFARSDRREARLRSPGLWLHSVRSPTFVFEGTAGGNVDALRSMARMSKNPRVNFLEVKGSDHFQLLGPGNRLITEKVLRDTGAECKLAFTQEEVGRVFGK